MKVNPLKYAQITVNCSQQFADLDQAIVFLGEAKDRMKNFIDARLFLRIAQAEKRLDLGQHHDCLEILEEVKGELSSN
jgi:chromosome condensin MukBEF complex kleisin-like MukF subunit